MTFYHLAQINVGRILGPIDGTVMAEFVAQLDEINALAEASPGFVWRLQSNSGNATDILVYKDPMLLINMSVWESIETLHAYTYRSDHNRLFKDRKKWFEHIEKPTTALWWVPTLHFPTPAEGKAKLELLERLGPTPEAFTIMKHFPPPED